MINLKNKVILVTGASRQVGAGMRLFASALAVHGRIDAVVNNAGVYLPSSLDGEDWSEGWATTLAVNVQAPADICRAAITHFREMGQGRIVNIASRAGHRGDGVDHAAYAASAGALGREHPYLCHRAGMGRNPYGPARH